jgi:hypothetical protein
MTIDGGDVKILEGPLATAGYAAVWRAGLKKVTNADGHRDLVTPTVTLQATGYEPLVLPIVIDAPKAVIEMKPSAAELKSGENTIIITARDAATGKDVEMRVMAGDRAIGKTNRPLQLSLEKGKKHPEIWVTSLFDRYSDQVVAKAQ